MAWASRQHLWNNWNLIAGFLLDQVAKQTSGRDQLACDVWWSVDVECTGNDGRRGPTRVCHCLASLLVPIWPLEPDPACRHSARPLVRTTNQTRLEIQAAHLISVLFLPGTFCAQWAVSRPEWPHTLRRLNARATPRRPTTRRQRSSGKEPGLHSHQTQWFSRSSKAAMCQGVNVYLQALQKIKGGSSAGEPMRPCYHLGTEAISSPFKGSGHLVRAEGREGCVTEQHRLMKQQTIITRQSGSRAQQKGIRLISLSLSPFHKSPLISWFPCVVHIAWSLLRARAVKCMCVCVCVYVGVGGGGGALFPHWEREALGKYPGVQWCCRRKNTIYIWENRTETHFFVLSHIGGESWCPTTVRVLIVRRRLNEFIGFTELAEKISAIC